MKIAIVGAGIAGLTTARLLNRDHQVTVFEADNRIGGHTNTIDVETEEGHFAIDTGFIVFNYANYPNLTTLFAELDVPVTKSNMSFGASFGGGKMEYGLASLNALFATRSNVVNPKFLRMVRDLLVFNKDGLGAAQTHRDCLLSAATCSTRRFIGCCTIWSGSISVEISC